LRQACEASPQHTQSSLRMALPLDCCPHAHALPIQNQSSIPQSQHTHPPLPNTHSLNAAQFQNNESRTSFMPQDSLKDSLYKALSITPPQVFPYLNLPALFHYFATDIGQLQNIQYRSEHRNYSGTSATCSTSTGYQNHLRTSATCSTSTGYQNHPRTSATCSPSTRTQFIDHQRQTLHPEIFRGRRYVFFFLILNSEIVILNSYRDTFITKYM